MISPSINIVPEYGGSPWEYIILLKNANVIVIMNNLCRDFIANSLPKFTQHPTNKLIVECVGSVFQKITKNNIMMCANLISIPRTPVVKEWVEIIELKK
jgi:hypothetical protein